MISNTYPSNNYLNSMSILHEDCSHLICKDLSPTIQSTSPSLPIMKPIKLRVIREDLDNWVEITEIMKKWLELAKSKRTFCRRAKSQLELEKSSDEKEVKSRFGYPVAEYQVEDPGSIFSSAIRIIKGISFKMSTAITGMKSSGHEENVWGTVLTCRDETNSIQAIGFVQPQANFLEFLSTHPDNIHNEYVLRTGIRGAGTQIILYLAQQSLLKKQILYLDPLPGSETFYLQFGFKKDWNEKWQCEHMKLTISKIQRLLDLYFITQI